MFIVHLKEIKCTKCNEYKKQSEFPRSSTCISGFRGACKKCERLRKKTWQVKSEYGIALEEYNKYMDTSDCCEICGRPDTLVYDHCHITDKFRGVLCSNCNRQIGALGDTIASLEKVLKYLRKDNE